MKAGQIIMSKSSKQSENNIWENRYLEKQTGWDRGKTSEGLLYWLNNGLISPCRILVPGCGNGYEVITLAEKGFDVTAIDVAPTPIKNLKAALASAGLNAQLIQDDFFNWQPEQPFDAIYEQTSLCALEPELWKQYEACLYQWLKPEGVLLAQFMQTGQEGGPPYHCEIAAMHTLFSEDKWLWSEQYNATEMKTRKAELMYMLIRR